jgi:hypothetical protein
VQSNFRDIACSLFWVPLPSFYRWLGQEHGRTIPLAVGGSKLLPRNLVPKPYTAGRKTML